MSDKHSNGTNISELSDQLKTKYSEDSQPSGHKIEKAKKMTDDDVKALLRMYYSDKETLPSEKEPSFLIDTSDFLSDEEVDTTELSKEETG